MEQVYRGSSWSDCTHVRIDSSSLREGRNIEAIAIAWMIALGCGALFGQTAPAFEVASIRPNRTATGRGSAEFLAGGERFSATNISIGWLILLAYDVTPLQVSLEGSIFAERYDIQAKAERPAGRAQMRAMIRGLLAVASRCAFAGKCGRHRSTRCESKKMGKCALASNRFLGISSAHKGWNEKAAGSCGCCSRTSPWRILRGGRRR